MADSTQVNSGTPEDAPRDFLYDLRVARTRDEVWGVACDLRLELESVLRAIEALTTTIEANIRRAVEADEPKGVSEGER